MGQGKKNQCKHNLQEYLFFKFPVLLAQKRFQQVTVKILSCWKAMLASVNHAFCVQAVKLTGMLVILPSGWIEGGGKIGFGLRLPETMEVNAHERKLLAGPSRLRLSWVTGGKCICWGTGLCGRLSWKLRKKPSCSCSFLLFSTKAGSMYILYKCTGLYWRIHLICTF